VLCYRYDLPLQGGSPVPPECMDHGSAIWSGCLDIADIGHQEDLAPELAAGWHLPVVF
jgi:hypothetical protein